MEIGWTIDWIWCLPIIVFTMIFHVLLLGLVFRLIVDAHLKHQQSGKNSSVHGSTLVIVFILAAIMLHAVESVCWGMAYLLLDALPNTHIAVLYSLNAMTTFGHVEEALTEPWKLMGAFEALNGILLFGLTTAFMFALLVRLNFAGEAKRTATKP